MTRHIIPRQKISILHGLLLILYIYTSMLFFNTLRTAGPEDVTFGRDYVNIWTAAKVIMNGQIDILYHVNEFHAEQEKLLGLDFATHSFSYMPNLIPLTLPFGLMPYALSFWVWTLGSFALFALALYKWRPEWDRRYVLLLALAPAVFINGFGGQNGFITAALFIGGLRLLGEKPMLAGVLFGLLTIKPQLGLLIPFALLAGGHWKTIIAAGITAISLVGISLFLYGTQPWLDYFHFIAPLQSGVLERGVGSYVQMMPTPFMAARHLGLSVKTGYVLNIITALPAVIGTVWVWRKTEDIFLRSATILSGCLLTTPYGYNYDMTLTSAAVLIMAQYITKPNERAILLAAWILPIAVRPLNFLHIPLAPVFLLLLFVLCLKKTYEKKIREEKSYPNPELLT